MKQVRAGLDVADREIADSIEPGDLVITADVPLAADVIKNGGQALNPRGELYNEDNIGDKLAMRDLMNDLRTGGMDTGGPSTYTSRDRQTFANALDRILNNRPVEPL